MIEFQHRQIQLPDNTPTIVCRIKGSIDGTTVYQFEDKLTKFIDQGFRRLIIVFSQVQYINSTGMGVLVKLADRSKDEQGDFCLVEVPDRIVGLFNVLGLLKLIKLFKTEEEAIKFFQPKKPGEAPPLPKNQPVAQKFEAPPIPPPPSPTFRPAAPAKPAPPAKLPIPNAMNRPASSSNNPLTKSVTPTINPKAPTPAPKTGATSPASKSTSTKPKSKVFAISCKKCGQKVALGTTIIEGTYKCPLCLATFKLFADGKVQFL